MKYKIFDIREKPVVIEGVPVKAMAVTYESEELRYRGSIDVLKSEFNVDKVKARIEEELKTISALKAAREE